MDMDEAKFLIEQHLNDPDGLSKIAVDLAVALYLHNQELAQADLEEKKVLVSFLDSKKDDGKGYSVAESEVRAEAQTDNKYKLKKVEGEAIIEIINSLKKRIEVLSWERKNG